MPVNTKQHTYNVYKVKSFFFFKSLYVAKHKAARTQRLNRKKKVSSRLRRLSATSNVVTFTRWCYSGFNQEFTSLTNVDLLAHQSSCQILNEFNKVPRLMFPRFFLPFSLLLWRRSKRRIKMALPNAYESVTTSDTIIGANVITPNTTAE